MKIQQTDNYEQFKKVLGNRKLYNAHIKELMDSIQQENLLDRNPIIVNEELEVIDGQHRLEAAKRLSLPIFYIVSEKLDNSTLDDIHLLQKMKTWTSMDFLESYIKQGNNDYLFLQSFMHKYDLTLATSLFLLSEQGIMKSSKILRAFKQGLFRAKNYNNAEMIGQRLLDLRPYLEESVRRSREFIYALLEVYEKVSHKELLVKFERTQEKIRQQRLKKDYLRILEDIYNFHRRIKTRFY